MYITSNVRDATNKSLELATCVETAKTTHYANPAFNQTKTTLKS